MKKIRLWKLGSLEHKIYPTREAINKLRDILNKNEDLTDLVWGPEISVEMYEVSDKVENYLVNEEGKLVKIEQVKEDPKRIE